VPLALLEQPWAAGKRILMLEPRRLAARAVAQRMARTLNENVGRTVGYRMRMETRVSRDTRIEVVTEGVLTRMLQTDPALEGVAAVVFDEFHERSLQADLGLALTLDARANLSLDLRLIVMSATLDGARVAALLGEAAIVTAQGRVFPVELRFMGKGAPMLPGVPALPGGSYTSGPPDSPEKSIAQIVQRALREQTGDLLVFLPGAREIRRVQSLLEVAGLDRSIRVLPLFGELSNDEQLAALDPPERGMRKIVLATNIAETSLTIEGVRVVIDSGLVRRSVFDPSTGMGRLETQRISRASADQRQGRAGRLESGVCYRAWSEEAQRSLAPFTPAEIVEADLVPLALELANWGVREASELRWLDEPPSAMLASARDLLVRLGALDESARITSHGRQVSGVGAHPRLGHMLLRATELGLLPLAADLAALLSERDLLRGASEARDADIRNRIELMRGDALPAAVDRSRLHRARRVAKDLAQQVISQADSVSARADRQPGQPRRSVADDQPVRLGPARAQTGHTAGDAGVLLAFAYPDRIGKRRTGASGYTLTNGRGAYFAEAQSLAAQELIVAVDLDDKDRDARILLAAPVSRADIEEHLSERLERGERIEWSSREQAVMARRFVRLDAIVLEENPLNEVPAQAAKSAMLQGIRELGIDALPWSEEARNLQARVEFVRALAGEADRSALPDGRDSGQSHRAALQDESDSGQSDRVARQGRPGGDPQHWPALSDAALADSTERWLAPWLDGVTRREHLARLSLADIVRALLPWELQRRLDELAPTHLTVPSGSSIRIDYRGDSAPAVSVRLQEVFGLEATPRIGGGRVPITFKLLSPAQRPVQVTRDLASFWRGAYAEVRKDLRGRYPKHYWPENPLEAQPTRGVRRRPPPIS